MATPSRSSTAGSSARSGARPRGAAAAGSRARGAAATAAPPEATLRGRGRGQDDAGDPADASVPTTATRLTERLGTRLSALPALAGRARERLSAYRTPAGTGTSTAATPTREPRRPADDATGTDWARVGIFGAGIVIGAFLGAGTALLLAPTSGFETRVRLARTARRASGRVVDRVEDLGDVVRRGAHRGKQTVTRGVTRGRWAVEDGLERRLVKARARAGRREV